MTRYNYEELKNKALKTNKIEDINELGEWFENFGNEFWNGEFYEIDNNNRLYPIYKEIEEDEFIITGYEIR